jgi:hypothetical protein
VLQLIRQHRRPVAMQLPPLLLPLPLLLLPLAQRLAGQVQGPWWRPVLSWWVLQQLLWWPLPCKQVAVQCLSGQECGAVRLG